jgi:hypothetical protein
MTTLGSSSLPCPLVLPSPLTRAGLLLAWLGRTGRWIWLCVKVEARLERIAPCVEPLAIDRVQHHNALALFLRSRHSMRVLLGTHREASSGESPSSP